ncbi:MAG: isoprenylcysteine carboxylmethyltransferase family protein [Cycloclasticus sp.]
MFSWLELKILPPVVALLAAGLMWLLSNKLGIASFDVPYKTVLCSLLVGLGLVVDFSALWRFRQAKTTVNPVRPKNASALVTSGIYQYTRNPMYVGNFIFLTAYLIWLGSPYNAVCLVLYVLYMNKFQIKPEERVLRNMFGDEYAAFCRNVRRWI